MIDLIKTEEADVRDRLWFLICERHVNLRKIGHCVHGDDFDAHTPKLWSRVPSKALEAVKEEAKLPEAGPN